MQHINVPFAPGLEERLDSVAAKARRAGQRVQEAQKDIERTIAANQKVSRLQTETLKQARENSERLEHALKQDKERIHRFKRSKEVINYVREVRDAFQGGFDVYSAADLLRSPHTRKALKAVGLDRAAGVLGDAVGRVAPYVYASQRVLQVRSSLIANRTANIDSQFEIAKMYAHGEIDASTAKYLRGIGSDWNDLNGAINPWGESAKQKRDKILDAFKATGSKELMPYMKKDAARLVKEELVALRKDRGQFDSYDAQGAAILRFYGDNDTVNIRNAAQLNIYNNRMNAERRKFKDVYGEPDDQDEKRMAGKLTAQIEREHPGFAEWIKKVEKAADEAKTADDVKHPPKKQTISERYESEVKKLAQRAQFNEYKRGYVPFNRVE